MAQQRKRQPRVTDPVIEPVVLGGGMPLEVEQIHVFTYGGTDYFMPGYVPPSLALGVMDKVRRMGDVVAMSWMLEEVLGVKAYDVLITKPDITKAQIMAVMRIVREHVLGSLEDEQGN